MVRYNSSTSRSGIDVTKIRVVIVVQMFLMQTIPQPAEQEKFILKRIISPICFIGMLTLKLKYSSVEINMVNYFTAKPYNGDNPYHKDLFYFPKN